MKSLLMCTFFLLCIGQLMTPTDGNVIGRCWDTWSRCSTWSRWFTGRVWLTCDGKCRELGKRGGNCVMTPSTCPLSSEAFQCQCYT
ncbi:Mytimacin-6 [Biomphalaria glabrata]|uniref:Uncharacterized protein n=1 Tax=Biomphalaria glabrata TaxID=6526 RepID=A0A182YTQ2_BIOGL|nr:Mytimacin-6 [Biomphalaria glabrata]KAI8782978.1 Mytimacin-6 [Biomphalaria glabrata]